jgi:surface protein
MSEILTFGNEILSLNGEVIASGEPPMPANSFRIRMAPGVTPTSGNSYVTFVNVSGDIWDATNSRTDWTRAFYGNGSNLLEIIKENEVHATGYGSFLEMYLMFQGCSRITSIPWFDTSGCTGLAQMFTDCVSLVTIPQLDTSNCTKMANMFSYCEDLLTIPLLDTSKVTNMKGMFIYCTSLETVPLLDTSKCTSMEDMFQYDRSLKYIPDFDISSCTNLNHTFMGCTNVESGMLSLYQKAVAGGLIGEERHLQTFYNCGTNTASGRAERAQIPTSWGGDLAE